MNNFQLFKTLTTYRPEGGNLLELFKMFEKGESRRDIKQKFIAEGKSVSYFDGLCYQLEGNMLEGVLTTSFKDYAAFRKNRISLYKDFASVQTLIITDNKSIAIPLAEKLLNRLLKYGMVNLALSIAVELELQFGALDVIGRKYYKYKKICNELTSFQRDELKARRLYTELAFLMRKKRDYSHILVELKKLENESNSPHLLFRLYLYSAFNYYYLSNLDEERIIETCNKAIAFFQAYQNPLSYTTEYEFTKIIIPIYIKNGKFGLAQSTAHRCVELCTKGSYNWHLSLIYLALIGFHSNKPAITLQSYRMAQKALDKSMPKVISEQWLLIRSYLELYKKSGELQVNDNFRLYKFLNSVPILEKDKKRSNVSVIIVHLLHLVHDREYQKFESLIDCLPDYLSAHLMDQPRSRYFLNMLKTLPIANYHPVRFERRVARWQKKMNEADGLIDVDVFESEVLPFERAWEMVRGWLG